MTKTFYNEWEPYPAQWLRNLIAAGHLPDGVVDERDMRSLVPTDCQPVSHFFAGIGGWPLALRMAGWPDNRPVWTASLPCQPFSVAGQQKGAKDERHLWPAFRELVAQWRPPVIFGEQVAGRLGRAWLAGVRDDMEDLGYRVGAADLSAASVGAPHIRQRLYWVAYEPEHPTEGRQMAGGMADPAGHHGGAGERKAEAGVGPKGERGRGPTGGGANGRPGPWDDAEWVVCADGRARRTEPGVRPLAHGVPARVGRLRAYGNAIVPPLAAVFIRAFMEVGEWRE